jgi:membrane-associated phospholipid phosphatase
VIFIYSNSRVENFLLINNLNSDLLDSLMPVITYLGDGVVAVIIGLGFMLYRIRFSIFLLISWASSGIMTQIFKRLIFPDRPRPLAFFNELGIDIHTIEGMDIPLRYSFPSGHTASAFAIFIGISFLIKSWYWKLILLLLAVIVGFSRVYIAVHFPVDVIAGSLLGVLFSFISFIWVSGWKKDWLDISLGSKIFKKQNS